MNKDDLIALYEAERDKALSVLRLLDEHNARFWERIGEGSRARHHGRGSG